MTRFNDLSIRIKLTTVIVLTSVFTLFLASIAFIINDRKSYQREQIANTGLLGQVIADNCASAVSFDDDGSAAEILQAAARDNQIAWAVIQTPAKDCFAAYVKSGEQQPSSFPTINGDGEFMGDGYIVISREIKDKGKAIGKLWIRSNQDKIKARLVWFIKISGVVLLAASIIGLFIAYFFQRLLSRPIRELENCARMLAVGNPDFLVEYKSRDELGSLADGFRGLQEFIQTLSDHALRIASGDLTSQVKPRSDDDILGVAFKEMTTNLSAMVHRLDASARRLVTAAADITTSSETMHAGARSQTDHIQQVATAIDEMAATIAESSRQTGRVAQASKEQSETATSGGQIVNHTIAGMNTVADVVRQSAESIAKLAQAAEQIGRIINVIEDIASQTNLLALNAAIEAARAGEQGRGFAVVADEVRKLAERTAKATGEITNVIKDVQTKTKEAVSSMEAGITEVEKGRELADKAGNSLGDIERMSQNVLAMIEQMASAAEQQAQVAADVTRRIEVISTVSQETASRAADSSEVAKAMNQQAEELNQIVAGFKVSKT